MSYEGLEVCMCKNGHLFFNDAHSIYHNEGNFCEYCGEVKAFIMGIDETNGYPVFLNGYFEELPESKDRYVCEKCLRPFDVDGHIASRYKFVPLKWTCRDGGVTFDEGCGPSATLHGWQEEDQ